MTEQTGTDTPATPTPVAPHEARLGERSPRLTLTHGLSSRHAEDEFDALADLFLGDDPIASRGPGLEPRQGASPRRSDAIETPPIEGLILGHLPVSASSWVKTYAAMRARALGGPVGLIRLMGGSLAIDLVGVDSRADAGENTIDQALDALRRRAVGIVARVDEMGEPDLAHGAIDGIVVLSGGDEAAIVAAFRTIKSLANQGEGRFSETPIRVAIVGHDAQGARDAHSRLSRSAMHSLSREIAFAGSVERLASEPSASLFLGEWGGTIGALLAAVLQRSTSDNATDDGPSPAAEDRYGASGAEVPVGAAIVADERCAGTRDEEGGGQSGAAADIAEDIGSRAADPVEVSPADAGTLASLIDGLALSEIRSPDSAEIEFAVDSAGCLHVVCAVDQAGRVDGVLGWAVRHEALLRLADPRIKAIDGSTPAHLVCTDAAGARGMLDGRHRVHLLVSIEVAGDVVRVTRPLN